MRRALEVRVSMTETEHFRRLVAFVEDVENWGRVSADDELLELVRQLRTDLYSLSLEP